MNELLRVMVLLTFGNSSLLVQCNFILNLKPFLICYNLPVNLSLSLETEASIRPKPIMHIALFPKKYNVPLFSKIINSPLFCLKWAFFLLNLRFLLPPIFYHDAFRPMHHALGVHVPGLLICKYQAGQKWPVPQYVGGP